ncbi:MAG: hypothetical protein OXH86_03065 [Acidimicrobiaceae bacterium]|nr:hypothetical protein [Acidimicrobiaceae bacterium]MDE0496311.1 hypothetical protein [Acidimicrobiaceae bacterium]
MSEAALLSTVVIAQFTVLAGLVLYIAQRIERRIDRLETLMYAEFAKVDARFEKVDRRFEKMEARFEKMEARFEKVDRRFEKMEVRMRAIELGQAKLVGRLLNDDLSEFELTPGDVDAPLSGATAPTT